MAKLFFDQWHQSISHSACIGCGVCAASCTTGGIEMRLDTLRGFFTPVQTNLCVGCGKCRNVCPILNSDTSAQGKRVFDGKQTQFRAECGFYRECYVGAAPEADVRWNGASGGAATWVLGQLLQQKKIDQIVAVERKTGNSPLFQCAVFSDLAALQKNSKSSYYPVEFSQVLQQIRTIPGRYAVVALPCVCHAIRLLQQQQPVFQERVAYLLGLCCGKQKSTHFAEEIIHRSKLGESAQELIFRTKNIRRPLADYGIKIRGKKHKKTLYFREDNILKTWVSDCYSLPGCFFCDDLFAECADIAFMDAWLPEYSNDPLGTNLIIDRIGLLEELPRAFTPISIDMILLSQEGAFRNKQRNANVLRRFFKMDGIRRPISLSWIARGEVMSHYYRALATNRPSGPVRMLLNALAKSNQIAWKIADKIWKRKYLS